MDKKYEEEPVTSLSTNNKRRRQKAVEKGREVLDLEGTPESSHTALPRADRTRKPPSYYSDIEHGRGRNHRATTPSSPNLLVHGGKENEGEDSQGRTIGVGDLEPQNDKTYWTEEEDDDDDVTSTPVLKAARYAGTPTSSLGMLRTSCSSSPWRMAGSRDWLNASDQAALSPCASWRPQVTPGRTFALGVHPVRCTSFVGNRCPF